MLVLKIWLFVKIALYGMPPKLNLCIPLISRWYLETIVTSYKVIGWFEAELVGTFVNNIRIIKTVTYKSLLMVV